MKDQNIGWSPEFKRWVFLDFGFAKFLRESVGEKTYTKFIGTFQFTTHELQKLFLLKKRGRVDFYYNDLYGLEKSFDIILEKIKLKKKNK